MRYPYGAGAVTAVDRLAWELRIREGVPLKLCGTIPSGTTVFGIEGTNTELRASLYKALALLGDDGSQGRPPVYNADELMRITAPGVGGGGGSGGRQRGPVCAYCGYADRMHSASCGRPRRDERR